MLLDCATPAVLVADAPTAAATEPYPLAVAVTLPEL